MNDRDIIVLKKMIQYADEIALTVEKLDLDFKKFETDFIAKNAIAMCVLTISKPSITKCHGGILNPCGTLLHITMANWILRYYGKQ